MRAAPPLSVGWSSTPAFDATASERSPVDFSPTRTIPRVTNPMTNTRLDEILADASVYIWARPTSTADVACCTGLARSGDALTFGSNERQPRHHRQQQRAQKNSVLNNGVARVKVVRAINYCAGNGTNIIGCAWIGGEGMALVRFGGVSSTRARCGLTSTVTTSGSNHIGDSRCFMYFCLCGDELGCDADRLQRLPHANVRGRRGGRSTSAPVRTSTTTRCRNQIDNCPGAANNSQTDGNCRWRGRCL